MHDSAAPTLTERTRVLANAFVEMAFVNRDVAGAVARYVSPIRYVQHHHSSLDGRDWNIAKINENLAIFPEATFEVKRLVVDGDIFVAHVLFKKDHNDLGWAIMEMFKTDADHIVEHWDIIQQIPDTCVSDHPFF